MDNNAGSASSASTKKTLINSLERLQHKTNQINDLVRLSQIVVDKFNRVDDRPKDEEAIKMPLMDKEKRQPDIMDLFNGTTDQIEKAINIIRRNLEDVMGMID